jgi:hypothetical protein
MPQKHNYVNGAFDVAVQIARERLDILHDIRVRCQKKQYDAVLLQCVRHLVGLTPDPQLTNLQESLTNERKAAASEIQPQNKTA